MKIANEFTVSAPIEDAWDVLTDLEQVIPLMPGAQMTGRDGDDVLGKVKVKVGPVTSEFSGKAHFVEQDRDEHRAVIDGKGKEARGTGNAAATVTAQLHDAGDRTRVTVDTDLKIVGKLAQFGSGMLQQVSEKLLGQFVESLEAKLAADTAPAHPSTTALVTPAAAAAAPQPPEAGADRPARARRWRCAEEVRPAGLRRLPAGRRGVHAGPAADGAKGAARESMTARLTASWRRPCRVRRGTGGRLRAGGVVGVCKRPSGIRRWLHAALAPHSRTQLYWAARLTLVNRAEDLRRVRRGLRGGVRGRRARTSIQPGLKQSLRHDRRRRRPACRGRDSAVAEGRPAVDAPCRVDDAPPTLTTAASAYPTPCPAGSSRAPTNRSTGSIPTICACIGTWLEQAPRRWPRRRSMRREPHRARQANRLAGDHESVARDRLGGDAARAHPQPRPCPPGGAGLRRQPIDAAVRHDLSASDARCGVAPEGDSTRGLRVLDVADPADRGAVAPVGGGGAGQGQRQGRRPLRRARISAAASASCWRRRTATRCAARW